MYCTVLRTLRTIFGTISNPADEVIEVERIRSWGDHHLKSAAYWLAARMADPGRLTIEH